MSVEERKIETDLVGDHADAIIEKDYVDTADEEDGTEMGKTAAAFFEAELEIIGDAEDPIFLYPGVSFYKTNLIKSIYFTFQKSASTPNYMCGMYSNLCQLRKGQPGVGVQMFSNLSQS